MFDWVRDWIQPWVTPVAFCKGWNCDHCVAIFGYPNLHVSNVCISAFLSRTVKHWVTAEQGWSKFFNESKSQWSTYCKNAKRTCWIHWVLFAMNVDVPCIPTWAHIAQPNLLYVHFCHCMTLFWLALNGISQSVNVMAIYSTFKFDWLVGHNWHI